MGNRERKFEAKISGELMGSQFDIQKSEMVRKQKEYFINAVKIETDVKSLLSSESSHNIIYYIIFGKQLVKLMRLHSAGTLNEELCALIRKWQIRGLDRVKLNSVRSLFLPGAEYCGICFRFDVSLLDGVDKLC